MTQAKKLCPRCKLSMKDNPVLNARSHNGKLEICTTCGQIESLEALGISDQAEGLRVGQKRSQAAIYGLDEKGEPKLPSEGERV